MWLTVDRTPSYTMSLGPPYIGIRVARSPGPGCKGIAPGVIETFLTLHTTDVAEKVTSIYILFAIAVVLICAGVKVLDSEVLNLNERSTSLLPNQ